VEQSQERVLFLFPQTGQLFTYYFMQGIIEDLRKSGVQNIFARTIVTERLGFPTPDQQKQEERGVAKQVEKIRKSVNPKRVIMVDLIATGVTREILRKAFRSPEINFKTLDFPEHQSVTLASKHPNNPRRILEKTGHSLRYKQNPKTVREMLFFAGRFFVHTHLKQ